MTENKVTFGLENVHVAPIQSISETGVITYGQVFRFPGAMELTLDPKGDSGSVKADNIDYYFVNSNEGCSKSHTSLKLLPLKFWAISKTLQQESSQKKQMLRQPTLLLCLNLLVMLTRHVMSCTTVLQVVHQVDQLPRTELT